jgi:hypothetical protein
MITVSGLLETVPVDNMSSTSEMNLLSLLDIHFYSFLNERLTAGSVVPQLYSQEVPIKFAIRAKDKSSINVLAHTLLYFLNSSEKQSQACDEIQTPQNIRKWKCDIAAMLQVLLALILPT